MTHTNAHVVKVKAKKPRNEGLHEILMSRKPGPMGQKRNKQKVSRKELWQEMENA